MKMISKKLMLNNVEYIVRARNKSELDKAVQFLYNCDEPEMAQLESRVMAPEMEVPAEPAIETVVTEPVKPQAPKRSNAPKAPNAPKRSNAPKAPKKDNKTVNLGGMGKSE
jgi:hypothetical protein